MKSVRILRIDPARRTIAAMMLKGIRDATPRLRQITRAKNVGGREIMKVRFYTPEQAQKFIDRINNGGGDRPMHVGDARILDEPY